MIVLQFLTLFWKVPVFQRLVMNECTALTRTQLTLMTLTFAEIAFWEVIFADGKIIIDLYGHIFATGRYVIVISSMIIVGGGELFCKITEDVLTGSE